MARCCAGIRIGCKRRVPPASLHSPTFFVSFASSASFMSTTQFDGVTVQTQANVYFEGKCISHSLTLADGTKKSVGVILPATLTFNTGAAEVMECVAGACDYLLAGSSAWRHCAAGESFAVPAHSSFQIRVSDQPYHYICHFE